MSDRASPIPPRSREPGNISPATGKIEKKVEKIEEVDIESQAKKFRKFVEEEETETEESSLTPFSLFSEGSPPIGVGFGFGLGEITPEEAEKSGGAVTCPEYSPPPSTLLNASIAEDSEPEPSLPYAQKFWQDVDEPPSSTPPASPQMEEMPVSSERTFGTKQEEKAPTGAKEQPKKEELLPPPKAAEKKGKAAPVGLRGPAEIRKEKGPSAVIKGKTGEKYVAPLTVEKLKKEEVPKAPPPRSPGELREEKPVTKEKVAGEKREEKKEKVEEVKPLQLESPTTTPLPEPVIPTATAAAAAAQPYLGPETLSIYFHMVGTITAMVSPKGDSRTEFILNSPAFAGSKFYGATVSIERFATAPYQLNIRLTGSNEAVVAFNQNIPNLLAAFQNGKFNYTINRIDAVYERPLIRRKEGKGEKDFEGGMGGK